MHTLQAGLNLLTLLHEDGLMNELFYSSYNAMKSYSCKYCKFCGFHFSTVLDQWSKKNKYQ